MNNKEKILNILEKNCGNYISGTFLSSELDLSRNTVWKYIGILKKEGINIKSSRKGYMLCGSKTVFSESEIRKYLKTDNISFEILKETTSTNDVARSLAQNGKKEGLVIISEKQTNGRGRRGRSFFSDNSDAIYLSILLRPDIRSSDAICITTLAAVCAARAIETVSKENAYIKWVNDIYVNDKKVCGILTEAAVNVENGKPEYVVLGMGINLLEPKGGFPREIENIAGAIFNFEKCDINEIKSKITAVFINEFFKYYYNLSDKKYFAEYKSRCFLLGREVTVMASDKNYSAKVLDIDENFGLIVKLENGDIKTLNSGEVSCRI